MMRLIACSPPPFLSGRRWLRAWFLFVVVLSLSSPAAGQSQWGDTPEEFVANYWKLPVPLQGEPPEGFSEVEASLNPDQCGICHPIQYNGWKASLHAGAASPGVMGQLVDVVESSPRFVTSCLACHAPLSEQSPKMFVRESGQGRYQTNTDFQPDLQERGIVCASCHVRSHQRFGPPPRKQTAFDPERRRPHDGFVVEEMFLKAEFCRRCHQHPPRVAVNGKPIMNTYNEWKEGPYAAQGVQCQDCHMPDRQHLWRGIHDPDMVKQGVRVELEVSRKVEDRQKFVDAALTVRNVGVGHYFPTYTTPSVLLEMRLLDQKGQVVKGSEKEEVIGRDLILSSREWREVFDTRIPPGGEHRFLYSEPIKRDDWKLEAVVTVRPDHFYFNFFETVLKRRRSDESRKLLEKAREIARSSPFEIFREVIDLDRPEE